MKSGKLTLVSEGPLTPPAWWAQPGGLREERALGLRAKTMVLLRKPAQPLPRRFPSWKPREFLSVSSTAAPPGRRLQAWLDSSFRSCPLTVLHSFHPQNHRRAAGNCVIPPALQVGKWAQGFNTSSWSQGQQWQSRDLHGGSLAAQRALD